MLQVRLKVLRLSDGNVLRMQLHLGLLTTGTEGVHAGARRSDRDLTVPPYHYLILGSATSETGVAQLLLVH
jgi:hypothetical protein